VINGDKTLVAGVNLIEVIPPRRHHWLIHNLTFSYNSPAIASGAVSAWFQKAEQYGDDRVSNTVTFYRSTTDLWILFPIIGGGTDSSVNFGARPTQERPFYLAWPNKIVIALTNAPAGRASQLRGMAIEAQDDISFEGLM